MRKIIHVDMDAFYAAVEQRDQPALRNRPIAVGAGEGRGVVMTASYEARVYGVRSAMPSLQARRLCPELLFVPPRFDAYKRASGCIRAILHRFTSLVEPLSLDEAYLDVTEPITGPAPAVSLARAIKNAIREETGLTASAGVSFNKFLAKTASDVEKPDGLTVIRPEQAMDFLAVLPIERFHGVGPATARKMHRLGIANGGDLRRRSEQELTAVFGRVGRHYWRIAHGDDDRLVEPDRPRRSLSVEATFARDLRRTEDLAAALHPLAAELSERLVRSGFLGRTLVLKLRFADFKLVSRRITRAAPLAGTDEIMAVAHLLLAERPRIGDAVRLLGIGVSNDVANEDERRQLCLPLLPLKEKRNGAS